MIEFRNKIYQGSQGRKSVFDCCIPEQPAGVIIFMHGYKGYKDWGAWNLVQDFMVKEDFGFVKFNLSHNGGTVQDHIDFPDLDAFGRNTYSAELFDLDVIITEVCRMIELELGKNLPVFLVGHSRGGGVAVLKAATDQRISKVVSLAGISDIGSRFPTGDLLEEWRLEGVKYVENARTGQQMPHYFSFYEDYIAHADQLDIEKAARSLKIPFLQVHGDMDTSVSISEGQAMAKWTQTELKIIKGADHSFGTFQPFTEDRLPEDMEKALQVMVSFLQADN
jgi:uncharacterized protein